MKQNSPATDIALIAVFAAFAAVCSIIPGLPVGFLAVPITLQTLAVCLVGLILGPWRGFASVALYVVLGLAGLPIFQGGAGGVGMLAKPAAGYVIAFPFAALLSGLIAYAALRKPLKPTWLYLGIASFVGTILIHVVGVPGLMLNAKLSFDKALTKVDILYWPGDAIKAVLAAIIAIAVHKAFPQLARKN